MPVSYFLFRLHCCQTNVVVPVVSNGEPAQALRKMERTGKVYPFQLKDDEPPHEAAVEEILNPEEYGIKQRVH